MLTEHKILEHANLLLEKRTLTPAEYHGWIIGATWAMREMEAKVTELERKSQSKSAKAASQFRVPA